MGRYAAVLVLVALGSACGSPKPPPNPAVSSAEVVGLPKGRGHELVVLATSCWLDGLWSDSLGERPEARERATHERCKKLLSSIDRPSEDEDALRLLDPRLVDASVRQLWRTALGDDQDKRHARELVALLEGVAAAAREMTQVHRLVDGVYALRPEQRADRATTTGTAQGLREASALRALLRMGGPFARDAHALGLVLALDRMDVARDLPPALKLDVLSGVFLEVFRVAAPKPDSSREQWVGYLADVAAGADHPSTATASLDAREALAWDGILTGFADRLRGVGAAGPIGDVARGAADRVDAAHVR